MSKIIGTCLGEYIKEGDVLYDPLTDTYKIKAGEKIMEIPGHALQSENLRTLKEALSNVDDENIKIDMLGSWAKARSKPIDYNGNEAFDDIYRKTYVGDWSERTGEAKTAAETAAEAEAKARLAEAIAKSSKTAAVAGPAGAPFDSQSFDPLRARVEAGAWKIDGLGASIRPADMGDWSIRISDKAADKLKVNSVYGIDVGAASHTSAPWDDPLAAARADAEKKVACMDMPEYRPDYNPNDKPTIYYHDRYPTIPIRSIINDAIELLNTKKNLHISKITFHTEKFGDHELSLAFSADHPTDPGLRKVLEVVFTQQAFDRAYNTDIDKYAKLKARLDTNTYMKLRIAFLLYQALKLNDSDAKKISLDIFRIFASDTRPNFHI